MYRANPNISFKHYQRDRISTKSVPEQLTDLDTGFFFVIRSLLSEYASRSHYILK
jgi:hypothetical protein